MQYFSRIGGLIVGIVVGSAGMAVLLSWAMAKYSVMTDINGGSIFAGLLTAGMVGALLTREHWLTV